MSIAPKPRSALLIVGHGSTQNPDSSTPYFEHAEQIRRRGIFAEVHCCFWKEEASLREAIYLFDSDEIYVVPDFISEGYFTQDVIPRELQLSGPSTVVLGKTFHYCLPVGIHPSMTGLILRRAREIAPHADPAATTLIITGHGTGFNQNSTKAIRDQVALIAASGAGYAAVVAAFMEESPFIADWDQLALTPNVVVVPFFISDGLHSYQDIPVLLGIETEIGPAASQREVFRHNPHALRGKSLFYSSAIGTEPLIADVILDLVGDFDILHEINNKPIPQIFPDSTETLASSYKLLHAISHGVHRIGEIEIETIDLNGDEKQGDAHAPHPFKSSDSNHRFRLSHSADVAHRGAADAPELSAYYGPAAAREIASYAEDGSYRFLKAQGNLRRGWLLLLDSVDDLRLALDQFYPASVGLWHAWQDGSLEIEHLRDKLQRQSGMYRCVRALSNETLQALVPRTCSSAVPCARRLLWQIDANTQLSPNPASNCRGLPDDVPERAAIPLLCREACNHFVAECLAAAKAITVEKKMGTTDLTGHTE